ncbi:hypothetical protein PAMA_019821 [Pampus argenteus]
MFGRKNVLEEMTAPRDAEVVKFPDDSSLASEVGAGSEQESFCLSSGAEDQGRDLGLALVGLKRTEANSVMCILAIFLLRVTQRRTKETDSSPRCASWTMLLSIRPDSPPFRLGAHRDFASGFYASLGPRPPDCPPPPLQPAHSAVGFSRRRPSSSSSPPPPSSSFPLHSFFSVVNPRLSFFQWPSVA